MNFSCEKALLLSAVNTAGRAVAAKSSIPALEGILLEAQGSRLTMTGYNLETGIRTTVEADIREGGSLVVSARLFGDIIRNLPDDDGFGNLIATPDLRGFVGEGREYANPAFHVAPHIIACLIDTL